jgi:hypothetical protein
LLPVQIKAYLIEQLLWTRLGYETDVVTPPSVYKKQERFTIISRMNTGNGGF